MRYSYLIVYENGERRTLDDEQGRGWARPVGEATRGA